MRDALTELMRRVAALPEFVCAYVKEDTELTGTQDEAALDAAVEQCWHDALSDLDVKFRLRVSPADAPAYFTPASARRLGFEPAELLGLTAGGEGDSAIYRIVRRDGMRFDIVLSLEIDECCAVLGLKPTRAVEVKDAGRFWPRFDLQKADAFWFVQIQALGKLMRGDYLIAGHLANCQVNETLVLQMIKRDDDKGTNIHRYGDHEQLTYRDMPEHEFSAPDATYGDIARRLCAAADAYDALMPLLNPDYEPRAEVFFDIWRAYELALA